MSKLTLVTMASASGAGGMEGGSSRTPSTPAPEPRAREFASPFLFKKNGEFSGEFSERTSRMRPERIPKYFATENIVFQKEQVPYNYTWSNEVI